MSPGQDAETETGIGRSIGLGHRDHPLLGRTVTDALTGRVGILRAICPEPTSSRACLDARLRPGDGPPVAWLIPISGGAEWTTDPNLIEEPGS